MSNNRIDNIMHKNTYNTSVNKKLDLQEDIEKLEEQQTILRGMVKAVSEENDSLQEKHKELLMKQTVGYDGWEEDLAGFCEGLDRIIGAFDRTSSMVDICETTMHYSTEGEYYSTLLNELCLKYPRISISSEELLHRGSITGKFKNDLDKLVNELSKEQEVLVKEQEKVRYKLKQTEELEKRYTKYLSEERKTGMWYFLGGCLVATVLTLMLK